MLDRKINILYRSTGDQQAGYMYIGPQCLGIGLHSIKYKSRFILKIYLFFLFLRVLRPETHDVLVGEPNVVHLCGTPFRASPVSNK